MVHEREALEVPAQGVGQHARDVTADGLASLDCIRDGVGLGDADVERYTVLAGTRAMLAWSIRANA